MSLSYPRFVKLVGLGRGAGALPAALVQSQLRAARAGYPATFAATVIAASAVLWSAPLRLTTNFAAAILCVVALLSLNRWREERRVDWCFADPRSAILSFARLSFVTALAWGVLMALLAATPDGPESLLATFCMIGAKTVVALTAASVPLAGLAFLGGSCIGAVLTTISSLADEIETETAGQTRVTGAIVEDARRAAAVATDLRGGVERSIDSSAAMRTLTEGVTISGTAVARQVEALSDAAHSFLTDLRAA